MVCPHRSNRSTTSWRADRPTPMGLPLVPTPIDRLTDAVADAEARAAMHTVRLIPYAGSAISPGRLKLATERLGLVLQQFYGSAEAPAPIVTLAPHDHVEEKNRF